MTDLHALAHRALRWRTTDPAELARLANVPIADAVRALALTNTPHAAVVLRPAEVARVAGRGR